MHGRTSAEEAKHEIIDSNALATRKPISTRTIQNQQADRSYFIKKMYRETKEFFHSVWVTLSFDHVKLDWRTVAAPAFLSVITFALGELTTKHLSKTVFRGEEDEMFTRFLLGTGIFLYSAYHSLTEQQTQSEIDYSAAFSAELLAILYIHYTSYQLGSEKFANLLPDYKRYAMIAGIGVSAFTVPGGLSLAAQKFHELCNRFNSARGAQRSDTALMPAGLTSLMNTWLTVNRLLIPEISKIARLFQLGLISDNILNAKKVVQQYRNLPALIIDLLPNVTKKYLAQLSKISENYEFNTQVQDVLRYDKKQKCLVPKRLQRHQIRTGDLVSCNHNFNFDCVEFSGEVVILEDEIKKDTPPRFAVRNIKVNNQAHNGEAEWREIKTRSTGSTELKNIDLKAISKGVQPQPGILPGSKLQIPGSRKNAYIYIKPAKEHTLISNYETKPIINQIISDHKQRYVVYSGLLSLLTVLVLQLRKQGLSALLNPIEVLLRTASALPQEGISALLNLTDLIDIAATLPILFRIYQVMIPFAESFTRENYNGELMLELNKDLSADDQLETPNALCMVDLVNARNGYYSDRISQGIAVATDKTGTLTTSSMIPRGLWTTEMNPDAQSALASLDEKTFLLPSLEAQQACFDVFVNAYTNNERHIEPEEFSILQLFGNTPMQIESKEEPNHFVKTYPLNSRQKTTETFHLGLYRTLGGRLTLVKDEKEHYLIFCGIPKDNFFADTPLLKAYRQMNARTGKLTRDWCVARAEICPEEFAALQEYFKEDNKARIEHFVTVQRGIVENFVHYGTFLINNPLKKEAEKFVGNLDSIGIPVFPATGDTKNATRTMATVLWPSHTREILTWEADQIDPQHLPPVPEKSAVIFVGMNDKVLKAFEQLLAIPHERRPFILFAEMSTEDKGKLAKFLRDHGYFVVANGDGSNDIAMMKQAHTVWAHKSDEGKYAPKVEQFAHISDRQIQQLLKSEDKSFYELIDLHKEDSKFCELFLRLANSQEKAIYGLILKAIKGSMDILPALAVTDITEPRYQFWAGPAMDPIFIGLLHHAVISSADLPCEQNHLRKSWRPWMYMVSTLALSFVQAGVTYRSSHETTNATWMILQAAAYWLALKSIFSGFGHVQDQLQPVVEKPKVPEVKLVAAKQRHGLFGACLRRRKNAVASQHATPALQFAHR